MTDTPLHGRPAWGSAPGWWRPLVVGALLPVVAVLALPFTRPEGAPWLAVVAVVAALALTAHLIGLHRAANTLLTALLGALLVGPLLFVAVLTRVTVGF